VNGEGLQEFAKHLIRRTMEGDREAYRELAEFVDILLVGAVSHRLGAADFSRLRRHAILRVPKACGRLKNVPRRPLAWIQNQIAVVYRDQSCWIADDRDRAADLQRRMLPNREFGAHGMEVAFGLRPFDILSGDFFDYSVTKRDALVAMGDVMGKGTAAALWAGYVLGQFRALNHRMRDLRKLTNCLNGQLHVARGDGTEYATVILLRWQPNQHCLSICNAGSTPPYLFRDGTVSSLCSPDHPIGMFPTTRFNVARLKPRAGDIVVMASDGLSDQPMNTGGNFPVEDLVRRLGNAPALSSATDLLDNCWRSFEEHTGRSIPIDDQTLVVIRFP
jgi:serine phosphatase RsbU (regulator of sigma subunit)